MSSLNNTVIILLNKKKTSAPVKVRMT